MFLKTLTVEQQIKRDYERALKNNQVIDLTFTPTMTMLYVKEKDKEEEWVNELYDRHGNRTSVDYGDVFLSYENGWRACTGTNCEWFECDGTMQDALEKAQEHVWHTMRKHIFMDLHALKKCTSYMMNQIYGRYHTIYLVDWFQSYESVQADE